MPRLKNQHLDSNSGHPDYEAITEPLCYVGLLTLNLSEWIFILNGWGRAIESVCTQIRTRDTHITRPALNHCAMVLCTKIKFIWSLDHPGLFFFTIVVFFSFFFCSFGAHVDKITNLLDIYTALCVMILRREIDIMRGIGRVVLKVSPVLGTGIALAYGAV